MTRKKQVKKTSESAVGDGYSDVLESMVDLLESARRLSARAVNSVMTATYWEIGRRIVELEQGGKGRAPYGQELLPKLATDLTKRFGRGFSRANLEYMRRFFEYWRIPQTPSGNSESKKPQTPSGEFKEQSLVSYRSIQDITPRFPLPWSHYVKLLSIQDEKARSFYEQEALRGGWSVRQLRTDLEFNVDSRWRLL